jgi:S1-C subfamily serine protease
MKHLRLFLSIIFLLAIVSVSFAEEDDVLKEKIRKNFEKLITKSKIQEPSPKIVTRAPGGVKRYREASNGIVLVVTANDVFGSGVVISNNGLVITNWHVVEKEPMVGLVFKKAIRPDKTSLREEDIFFTKVLKTDHVRDLALLQIVSPPRDLTVLMLGSFKQVEVGQDVFAISHPQLLLWSYTEGVVSQIRPNFNLTTDSGTTHRATYIQTQTAISQGSSGGALFNYDGQLIGILVATLGPGLNFAIAVNEVQGFVMSTLEKR